MSEKPATPAKVTEGRPDRWEPFERMAQIHAEFDRLFGDRWPMHRMSEASGTVRPRTDVYEKNGSIVVKAELPGMQKEDINVALADGDLIIRGEHTSDEKVEETDFYRMERSLGSVYRRLPLPQGVTVEQIKATYADGVLQVTIPKPSGTEPTQSRIPVG